MTRRVAAPLPWLAGLLAIYLIAPLIAGLQQLGAADWSTVDIASLGNACAVSIASASTATAVIALAGIPLGYVLARKSGRAMSLLGFVVQLPLALPPLASGILLLFLIGYPTTLGHLFHGALTDSFAGIVLAEIFVAAPFLIIAARSGFASVDPVLEDVAATLGRNQLDMFWRVSLPLAWPAIAPGLLLTWLRAFGEFGATVMVAYHPYSLPVYTYVAFGSQGLPAMMPVLLPTLVLALAIMALSQLTGGTRDEAPAPASVPALAVSPVREAVRPPQLDIEIEKRLGDFGLEVSWAPRSHRLAILGPSGSGKSLTLKLVAGAEDCDRGRIAVDGKDIAALPPPARAIAYVPQNYGLFPHLSVMQQLQFPVGADPATARHWIERLGLGGLENRRPAALSLGQQQRVALARAFNRPASLLLLDEPFSALDAPLRARLRQEFAMLQQELSATTILVTHDPVEAALLADEIMVLADGKSLQSGPTALLFRRPASETVARLLGADNMSSGVAAGDNGILLDDGTLIEVGGPKLCHGRRVGWSFPPARAWISANGRYVGTVESVTPIGMGQQIALRVGDTRLAIVGGNGELRPGAVCRFVIDPHAIQVWPLA